MGADPQKILKKQKPKIDGMLDPPIWISDPWLTTWLQGAVSSIWVRSKACPISDKTPLDENIMKKLIAREQVLSTRHHLTCIILRMTYFAP